ncbi:hypothetical protein BT93_D1141 [Corymbia citriodora subsp. variegata]|nr:hypothetical protein BT93_D1141 [Corymbia citriodora subsp. variegata]
MVFAFLGSHSHCIARNTKYVHYFLFSLALLVARIHGCFAFLSFHSHCIARFVSFFLLSWFYSTLVIFIKRPFIFQRKRMWQRHERRQKKAEQPQGGGGGSENKGNEQKVSFFKLFIFADRLDVLHMFVGTIGAIVIVNQ